MGNSNISGHDVNYTLLVQSVSGIPEKLKAPRILILRAFRFAALGFGEGLGDSIAGLWSLERFDVRRSIRVCGPVTDRLNISWPAFVQLPIFGAR